jgi:hypothetical protein
LTHSRQNYGSGLFGNAYRYSNPSCADRRRGVVCDATTTISGTASCWWAADLAVRASSDREVIQLAKEIVGHVPAGVRIMKCSDKSLTFVVAGSLLLATAPGGCAAEPAAYAPPPPALAAPGTAATGQAAQPTAAQLDQLVAPIALYPDPLVAQILAAATDPTEVVEADRWLQQNSHLQGTALAQAVDKQVWDPSVKALVQFPAVLHNMSQNLAWTSALGDANASNARAVLNAVQAMRRRAQQAGNLKSTPQQTVTTQGQTVVIQPANPEVVYVPQYDPWIVYGAPVGIYPYWDPYPGLFLAGAGLAFGVGIGIGLFAHFGWGWGHWGANWHGGRVMFNHRGFVGRGGAFGHDFHHGFANFAHAGGFHGAAPHAAAGFHGGAFHGLGRAGDTRAFAARGRSSFGGGFHGGGFHAGGFHGGGFHGGGRR